MSTIHVLFGTESGNAELVADDIAEELTSSGYECVVSSMDGVDVADIADGSLAVIITSTYGDGELPMTAIPFQRALVSRKPDLSRLRFLAFGLGDSTYDTYNNAVEALVNDLVGLGAVQLGQVGRHDAASTDDCSDAGVAWIRQVLAEGVLQQASLVEASGTTH